MGRISGEPTSTPAYDFPSLTRSRTRNPPDQSKQKVWGSTAARASRTLSPRFSMSPPSLEIGMGRQYWGPKTDPPLARRDICRSIQRGRGTFVHGRHTQHVPAQMPFNGRQEALRGHCQQQTKPKTLRCDRAGCEADGDGRLDGPVARRWPSAACGPVRAVPNSGCDAHGGRGLSHDGASVAEPIVFIPLGPKKRGPISIWCQ